MIKTNVDRGGDIVLNGKAVTFTGGYFWNDYCLQEIYLRIWWWTWIWGDGHWKKRKRGIRLSTGQTVLDVLRTCLVLYFVYFAELAMRLTSFPEEKIFPPDMLKVSHHFTYFCGIIGSLYIPWDETDCYYCLLSWEWDAWYRLSDTWTAWKKREKQERRGGIHLMRPTLVQTEIQHCLHTSASLTYST